MRIQALEFLVFRKTFSVLVKKIIVLCVDNDYLYNNTFFHDLSRIVEIISERM